jgi:3-oxoacyl-(acyl-carrier-protein) synthase
MTSRRVAITGLGVFGPHGDGVGTTFDALLDGRSAIANVEISADVGTVEIAGAAISGRPWERFTGTPVATCDKVSLYALIAADAAIRDAGLNIVNEDLRQIGIAVGTSLGGAITQEAAYQDIFCRQKKRLSPFTLVKVMYNGPAAQIGLKYGFEGPSLTYSTTCSSSSVAIGEAMRSIRHGYADVIVAGGSEALFTYVAIKAWQALHVLAPEHPDIAATCRPFSRDRNGTVLGEGAAFVVLEEFERARKRGATIYAELSGYGVCNDAKHMTQPSIEGQVKAMELALSDSNMCANSIDYINAHGTGTILNDATETLAIRRAFGSHAYKFAVSSTKSMHGHLVGAAGALELLISVMSIHRQSVPPTAHLVDPDPECDLDYVAQSGRRMHVRAVMTNSFAVGGTAAVLIARQPS